MKLAIILVVSLVMLSSVSGFRARNMATTAVQDDPADRIFGEPFGGETDWLDVCTAIGTFGTNYYLCGLNDDLVPSFEEYCHPTCDGWESQSGGSAYGPGGQGGLTVTTTISPTGEVTLE